MSGLETAASVLGIADLARKTALFLRQVYSAHVEARELCEKTDNLSQLVKNVNRILEQRKARRKNGATDAEAEVDKTIASSLDLCRTSLGNIYRCFKPLIERDPNISRAQLRDRFKFVYRKGFISSQESNMSMQLSVLSVALNLANNEERRQFEIEERNRREEAQRRQQGAHEAFLRQLFALYQHLFRYAKAATAAAAATTDGVSSMVHPELPTNTLGPTDPVQSPSQPPLLIDNELTRRTIEDLFGISNNPRNQSQELQPFVFNSSIVDADSIVNEAEIEDRIEEIVTEDKEAPELDIERTQTESTVQQAKDVTLLLAIKRGQIDLVRNLISDGSDATTTDVYGWTLLHHAVFRLHKDVVNYLLGQDQCRSPVILDAKTRTGETALILAVQTFGVQKDEEPRVKAFDIIVKLLDSDCNVNIEDDERDGRSAFYYAVEEGKASNPRRRSLVRRMANKGANVKAIKRRIPEQLELYEDVLPEDTCTDTESRRSSNASSKGRRGSVLRRMSEIFKRRTSSSAGPTNSKKC